MQQNARSLVMMSALILLPIVLWHVPFVQQALFHSRAWGQGPWAWGWFLLIAIPYCAAGLPRQALCIGAGAAFGVGLGFVVCSIAYQAGALMDYASGRAFGDRWSTGVLRHVAAFVRSAPFRGILSLRLLPVGSSLMVSVAAGGLRVPWVPFAMATALGGVPQNLIFVLMGSGLPVGHGQEVVGAFLLFLVSVILGIVMIKRYRTLL